MARRPLGFVVVAVAVAGSLLSVWVLLVVVQHAGRPVHDLPPGAVVAGVAGAVASLGGWMLVARSRDGVVLGGALLGLLLVAGVVSLLSVGVLLLLVGGGVSVVLGRAAGRRRAEGRPVAARRAAVAAALVGIGLPLALLVASDGPIVECRNDGVSSRSSLFRGAGGRTSAQSHAATSARAGEATGVSTSGGRIYRYRCVGDELVEFDASDA